MCCKTIIISCQITWIQQDCIIICFINTVVAKKRKSKTVQNSLKACPNCAPLIANARTCNSRRVIQLMVWMARLLIIYCVQTAYCELNLLKEERVWKQFQWDIDLPCLLARQPLLFLVRNEVDLSGVQSKLLPLFLCVSAPWAWMSGLISFYPSSSSLLQAILVVLISAAFLSYLFNLFVCFALKMNDGWVCVLALFSGQPFSIQYLWIKPLCKTLSAPHLSCS